jgi:hypothetical protein
LSPPAAILSTPAQPVGPFVRISGPTIRQAGIAPSASVIDTDPVGFRLSTEAEIEKHMAGRNLAKKVITAKEIAHVVTFLASPKAIAVNGGAPGGNPLLSL